MRRAVVIGCVLLAARVARADWYFDWHCESTSTGTCGQTGLSGTEGPFSSSSDCESAYLRVVERINGPGNAGTASSCHDSSSSGGSSSTGTTKPARLDRVFLGAVGGAGYTAAYANGRNETAGAQEGMQLEFAFGFPKFGLTLFAGIDRDAGTAPDATTPVTPMWFVDWGLGLVTSPFAIVDKPTLEIRPELGAYVVELDRFNCDRCSTDGPLGTQMPAEPGSAFGGRFRAGVDVYFGAGRANGVALDALIQLVKLGDAADPLSSAVMTPPRVMVRLSFVHRASP